MRRPSRLLTIAGSDSGGGAGVQADLKTFAAHGAFGMSAITAVTAQNTVEVRAIHAIPAAVVAAQIDAVFDDLGVDGVKIGMLGEAETVRTVAACLRRRPGVPIVLDPVMVSKGGAILLEPAAVTALAEELMPLATVVTPNLPEATALSGVEVDSPAGIRAAARHLHAMSDAAILVKGGHGTGDEVVDVLFDGVRYRSYRHPRLASRSTHGTGCTLSAALACRLARHEELAAATEAALSYVEQAMRSAAPLGAGHGPLDHLYGMVWKERR